MNKVAIFTFFVLQIFLCTAQTSTDNTISSKWLDSLVSDENIIKPDDAYDILNMDLSDLFTTDISNLPIGFIGNNFQRFQIIFNSVTKSKKEYNIYNLIGKNKVKKNICDFSGTMKIIKIYHFKKFPGKKGYPANGKVGLITGTYLFNEDSTQNHAGTLQGNFVVRFYLSSSNQISIDEWTINTDDTYTNNQFVGIWKSYETKTTQPCHFGNYRVPVSDDLDYGNKEFYPNDRYIENGWQNYGSLLNTDWWK